MIGRRYLRTKVMQAIFAYEMNSNETLTSAETKLNQAIESCYTLHLYFLSLFSELKTYRLNKIEDARLKISPTMEDINPNTKFVDNLIIAQIEENHFIQKYWRDNHVSWTDHKETISQIYKELSQSPCFITYLEKQGRSYAEDKAFILEVIETVFVPNQLLHWFFGEKFVHWFNDYDDALLITYNSINSFSAKMKADSPIKTLFSSNDDIEFYQELFRKTLLNNKKYEKMIEDKLKNWEVERLIGIDMILMKMALCEIIEFPTIPIKVTINEYIEISKYYSSHKSKSFINGLLDKLVFDLKEEGQLKKIGRGLIDN